MMVRDLSPALSVCSPHVHNIVGGSNFNLDVTFDSLRQSECTSCLVKQDL